MPLGGKKKRRKGDVIVDGVGVTLSAIRDSADAFPPLKSAAAGVMIVVEMSQKMKSNKEECRRIADKAAKVICDIWRQTKDYGDELPLEVRESLEEIESVFCDILSFMQELRSQTFFERYASQDRNRVRIRTFEPRLDDAMSHFSISVKLALLRLDTKTSQCVSDMEDANQRRRAEVIRRIDLVQCGAIAMSIVLFK